MEPLKDSSEIVLDRMTIILKAHTEDAFVIPENMPRDLVTEYKVCVSRLHNALNVYKTQKSMISERIVYDSFDKYMEAYKRLTRYIDFFNTYNSQEEVL